MNAIYRPPQTAPVIPENAPFSPEQRAWLNGFFAGLLSSDSQSGLPFAAKVSAALVALAPGTAPQVLEDDGAPWHDQTLPLGERMQLAEGRPLPRRMMAAMAQQDCGQCGYNCEHYANAIAEQSEDRISVCLAPRKPPAR
jgi:sulfite reductase (NADPH) flavoprotein alpha-component